MTTDPEQIQAIRTGHSVEHPWGVKYTCFWEPIRPRRACRICGEPIREADLMGASDRIACGACREKVRGLDNSFPIPKL